MELENLLLKKEDGVAVITFNRPEAMNSLTLPMRKGLAALFTSFRDDSSVRAVVLTGAGRAFCAGGDIKAMQDAAKDPDQMRRTIRDVIGPAVIAISTLEKPVIAMVNGAATGSGCSIALMCDLVIASDQARFAMSFVKVGLAADWGGGYFLARRVGPGKAKELLYTGKLIDAREAQAIGLANQVVPAAQLEATTMELARALAASPTKAIGAIKTLVDRGLSMDLLAYLEHESYLNPMLVQTHDHQEGVRAFIEKRPPAFKGH